MICSAYIGTLYLFCVNSSHWIFFWNVAPQEKKTLLPIPHAPDNFLTKFIMNKSKLVDFMFWNNVCCDLYQLLCWAWDINKKTRFAPVTRMLFKLKHLCGVESGQSLSVLYPWYLFFAGLLSVIANGHKCILNPYYHPVCGNDMRTYGNKDILDCFNRQRPRNRRKYPGQVLISCIGFSSIASVVGGRASRERLVAARTHSS